MVKVDFAMPLFPEKVYGKDALTVGSPESDTGKFMTFTTLFTFRAVPVDV
jgi:hypothetical protein